MHHAPERSQSSRLRSVASPEVLAECISECFACAQSCTVCADACLAEEVIEPLARCIRLNLDCAAVCVATGEMLSRRLAPDVEVLRRQVEVLAFVCRICADECARHADAHDPCRVCLEACRRCEAASVRLARLLPPPRFDVDTGLSQ